MNDNEYTSQFSHIKKSLFNENTTTQTTGDVDNIRAKARPDVVNGNNRTPVALQHPGTFNSLVHLTEISGKESDRDTQEQTDTCSSLMSKVKSIKDRHLQEDSPDKQSQRLSDNASPIFLNPKILSDCNVPKSSCSPEFLLVKEKFSTPPDSEETPFDNADTSNIIGKIQRQICSAPKGTSDLLCTLQKPFAGNAYTPKITLNEIKQQLTKSLSSGQWSQIHGSIDDNSKSAILSQLAKTIVHEMPVMSIYGNLSVYSNGYWHYLDLFEFITTIRCRFWQHQNVLDNLSESNFREIMIKVKTTPGIKKTESDIKLDPDLINFRDGTYDIKTNSFIEQSPDHHFFSFIDMSIGDIGKGTGSFFEYYMQTVTDGDEALYNLILEVLAITLSSYMVKGFFLFLGPSDSGKSQIAHLIERIIGKQFVTVIPKLNSLKKPHTTATLKGKKVCLCMDIARDYIDEESLAILKQVSGNDTLSIERKYHDMETLDNTAKLILGANHLPPVNDPVHNDAYFRRMKIIPFRHAVPIEKQIPFIADKMAGELGYIVEKILNTLAVLSDRDYKFTEVETDIDEFGAIATSNRTSVDLFYDECCFNEPGSEASTKDLYIAYSNFCLQKGETPRSKISFSQEFAKKASAYEKKHTSRNGDTLSIYKDLKVKEDTKQ